MFKVPEEYREAGTPGKKAGMFNIPGSSTRNRLIVIASDGMEWEHVSVSKKYECPTWSEMCRVKELFWDDEDTVVQIHVPKSRHINIHPYCLHLWRQIDREVNLPPEIMV